MTNKLFFALFSLSIAACKQPGDGGDASIRGYVHAEKFNSTFTQFLGQYPARDVDVYLIYGDDTWGYDDRTRTDYNGRFEFPNLYPGDYRLYVYTRDSTHADASGVQAVVRDVHIDGRKSTVEIDTMLILQ